MSEEQGRLRRLGGPGGPWEVSLNWLGEVYGIETSKKNQKDRHVSLTIWDIWVKEFRIFLFYLSRFCIFRNPWDSDSMLDPPKCWYPELCSLGNNFLAQDLTGRQIKMDALDKQAKELQIAGDRRSAGWRMCRMGYVVRIYRRFGFWLGDIVFNGIFMGWSCQQYHLKRFFRSNFDQSDTGRYSFIRFRVLVRIDEVPLSVIIDLLWSSYRQQIIWRILPEI